MSDCTMNRRKLLKGLAAESGVGMSSMAQNAAVAQNAAPPLFDRENLIAWCIVPFDAKMRGPEARAEMLQRLGFKRFAYDWREKDIPTFDQELDALQRHGVSLDAFWFP